MSRATDDIGTAMTSARSIVEKAQPIALGGGVQISDAAEIRQAIDALGTAVSLPPEILAFDLDHAPVRVMSDSALMRKILYEGLDPLEVPQD